MEERKLKEREVTAKEAVTAVMINMPLCQTRSLLKGAGARPEFILETAPLRTDSALEDEEEDDDQDNSAEADIHKISDGVGD